MSAQKQADVIESLVKSQKKEYLASLPKFKLKFFDVINLGEFLISKHKQLFVIGTVDTTLETARIYNILQQHYNTNINPTNSDNVWLTHGCSIEELRKPLERFLGNNNQTFLDWKTSSKFLKKATALIKFSNLVVVEFSNLLEDNLENTADLDNFMKSVLANNGKLIFVYNWDGKKPKEFSKPHSSSVISREISNISFSDLRKDSQRQIITKSLFTFKGVPTTISDFLKIDACDNLSKEMTKRLNQIVDSDMLKFMSDDKFVPKEISTHFYSPDIFYLSPTYLNIPERISLQAIAAFINNSRSASYVSENPILMLIDCSNQPKAVIEQKICKSLKVKNVNEIYHFSIIFRSEVNESDFIQLCKNSPESKIYWFCWQKDGEISCKKVYDINFYIKRKFCNTVHLKRDLIKIFTRHWPIPDLFIFDNVPNRNKLCEFFGIEEKEFCKLQRRDNIVVTALNGEERFNVELKRDIDRPVHLIRFDENRNKFWWVDSQGSLENVRNFVVMESDEMDAALLSKKKVIILGGSAGEGKFSCLCDVMRHLPETSWVVRINFKRCQNVFKRLPSIINVEGAVNFLSANFSDGVVFAHLLADVLYNNTSRSLYLLFEDFDDVLDDIECSDSTTKMQEMKKITKLLEFFKKQNNFHIWIVSKRHIETMENMVSTFRSRIMETEASDHKTYLVNLWQSKISLSCGTSLKMPQLLENYAEKIVRTIQPIFRSQKEHVGIPLQLRLILEVTQPSVENLTKGIYFTPELIDISYLLKKYLLIQYKLYLAMHQDESDFFLDFNFGTIAFKQLFLHDHSVQPLGPYEHINFKLDFNENIFLRSTEYGQITFVHGIFLQFFTSTIIANWILNPKYLIPELLLTEILFKPRYKLLRLFLNNAINVTAISAAALHTFANHICKYWKENEAILINRSKCTIFHIIVEENLSNIALLFLTQNFTFTKEVASYFVARNKLGKTALFLAAENRSEATVNMILEYFSNLNIKQQERLLYATLFGKPACEDRETTKYLMDKINKLDWSFQQNELAKKRKFIQSLYMTVLKNDIKSFKKLAEAVTDEILYYLILWTDDIGLTLLHSAASKGYVEIVQYLSKQNNYVDLLDQQGACPLHNAAKHGNLNVLETLIGAGSGLDAFDRNCIIPLEYAARGGHKESVKYLIEQGSDVNHQDAFGMTAISWAIKSGHLNTVQYLVSLKTDLTVLDCYGRNLLQIAIQSKQWRVVNYLIFCEVDINTLSYNSGSSLQIAIKMRNWDIAKLLISVGAEISIVDKDNLPPIWYAEKANKLDLVICMIEKGAEVTLFPFNVRNKILNYALLKTHVVPKPPINSLNKQYNAFYNLIRLGNIDLLQMLIEREYLHEDSKCEMLVKLLAEPYEELLLRKVPLLEKVKYFIEERLVLLRGFGKIYRSKENMVEGVIGERIKRIISTANKVQEKYSGGRTVDQDFIIHLQFISENIQTLKRCLRYTYNKVPWEEMEFCLVIFITLFLKPRQDDFPYRAVLDQNRILMHLSNFVKTLDNVKHFREKDNFPSERLKHINKIKMACPELTTLFDDFNILKDIYSLTRVSLSIEVALTVSNTNEHTIGVYAIERCLQVIGESFKNTYASPNLSEDVINYLLYFASKKLKKMLTTLRDTLSHSCDINSSYNITERIELENRLRHDTKFLESIQNDLKKIMVDAVDILSRKKTEAMTMFWTKVINSSNISDIKQLTRYIKFDAFFNLDLVDHQTVAMKKLKTLLLELNDNVDNMADIDTSQLTEIINDISKNRSEPPRMEYSRRGLLLYDLIQREDFVTIYNFATVFLADRTRIEKNQSQISNIYNFIASFQNTILEGSRPCHQIFLIMGLLMKMNKIDGVEYTEKITIKMKKKMKKKDSCKQELAINLHIKDKLDILHKYLKKNVHYLKTDKVVLAGIEMLALDVINHLLTTSQLAQHKTSYDEYSPVLIGKSLRNYLAHGDCLIDALPFSPVTALLSTIQKIVNNKSNLFNNNGMWTETEFNCNYEKFENMLNIATIQSDIFHNFKQGIIKEGDEIKAIDIFGNSSLNYAIMSNNIDLINVFLIRDNISITLCFRTAAILGAQNIVNQISVGIRNSRILTAPLFIAVKNGHTNVVSRLLDLGANIDIKDISQMSLLDVAITYGHKDIVARLLKLMTYYKKGTNISSSALEFAAFNGDKDMFTMLVNHDLLKNMHKEAILQVLCSAAQNGHKDVVTILIDCNVDINAYWNGETTPLHIAVNSGHKKLVDVILDRGADTNAHETFDSGGTPLHVACQNGNKDIAELLIKRGSNINAKNKNNVTPLHMAAACGHKDLIISLLERGADINAQAIKNSTPLFEAADINDKDIIEILLKRGANINAQNTSGYTALHRAATNGNEDVVTSLLLRRDINHSVKAIGGFPALQSAVRNGHQSIVKRLLDSGADIHAENNTGETAIFIAASNNHNAVVTLLLNEGAKINAKDQENATALFQAAYMGFTDVVDTLLKNGADVHATKRDNSTILNAAVQNGHKDITQMLLDYGADVNLTYKRQCSSLQIAIRHNHTEIVKLLLDGGANINYRDRDHNHALHLAVQYQCLEAVKILLDCKTDINAKGKDEWSALHLAAQYGYDEIARTLLGRGANVNAKEVDDWTPLHLAAKNGHDNMVKCLLEQDGIYVNANKNNDSPLYQAAGHGHDKVVSCLLDHGAIPDFKEKGKWTSLYTAAQHGHLNVVQTLLIHGADPNIKENEDNGTALHMAAFRGHLDVVLVLLNHGTDVNCVTKSNFTALHLAAQNGFPDIVNALLDQGVDVDARNNDSTALYIAADNGHTDVVTTLLNRGAKVNNTGKNQFTALNVAVVKGHRDIVLRLLASGANVNATGTIPVTSLVLATLGGFKDIVGDLLDYGADVEARDENNTTALYYAALRGYMEIVVNLINHGADINARNNDRRTVLCAAAGWGHTKIVAYLLQRGANVNSSDIMGRTAIYMAAHQGYKDIIELLLNSRVKVDSRAKNRWAPLHIATSKGYFDIVTSLLNYGTDVNMPGDPSNNTALHIAACNGYSEIALLLMKRGANVNAINNLKHFVLFKAAQMGREEITLALIKCGAKVNAGNEKELVSALFVSAANNHTATVKCLLSQGAEVNRVDTLNRTALHIAVVKGHINVVVELIRHGANVNIITVRYETPLYLAVYKGYLNIMAVLLQNGAIR